MTVVNKPYVKLYEGGVLVNPLVKGANVPQELPNRKTRRGMTGQRALSNKKGLQVLVTRIGKGRFVKYHRVLQYIKNKVVAHFKLK